LAKKIRSKRGLEGSPGLSLQWEDVVEVKGVEECDISLGFYSPGMRILEGCFLLSTDWKVYVFLNWKVDFAFSGDNRLPFVNINKFIFFIGFSNCSIFETSVVFITIVLPRFSYSARTTAFFWDLSI
jgi:hypothetical protein